MDRTKRLAARCAVGDRRAFAELYDLTCGAAWRTAVGSGLPAADAEQVLRQTYLELWLHAAEDAVRRDPRRWLLAAVHRAAVAAAAPAWPDPGPAAAGA